MTTGERRPAEGMDGPEQLRSDLRRARAALFDAEVCVAPADRYLAAHLAALRMAAMVLSVRSRSTRTVRPGITPASRAPRDAWVVLAEAAPELAEWAGFFAATQPKKAAVEAGLRYAVSAREADDLVRDASSFLSVIAPVIESVIERGCSGSSVARSRAR